MKNKKGKRPCSHFVRIAKKKPNRNSINKIETFNIRGESIPIQVEYYHCQECGEDFDIPRQDYDPLDQAYREYRQCKGMLQPEAIKQFRQKMGLSQEELSGLLGIGVTTLNRYENGALQSEANDQALSLIMKPDIMRQTLERKPDALSSQSREDLMSKLRQSEEDCEGLLQRAINDFGSYMPDIYSGATPFNANKLFQAIKFFCYKEGVFITKLMKLLFYADFYHYKQHSVSITGTCYAHATFGPVPNNFKTWLAALSEWENEISVEEQLIGDYSGEIVISGEPQWSIFSTSELAALSYIKDKFSKFTARQIGDFSHAEAGYHSTKNGELISYQYALELNI